MKKFSRKQLVTGAVALTMVGTLCAGGLALGASVDAELPTWPEDKLTMAEWAEQYPLQYGSFAELKEKDWTPGFEVCERIRAQAPGVPVLFLSAKGEVEDKKTGLRSGADDYMIKPFDAEELLLRVAALLRRAGAAGPLRLASAAGVVTVGDLSVNFRRHEVERAGEKLSLTPKEFQILAYLAERAGEVVGQRELIEELWGSDYIGEPTSVAVYVRHIREKIERDPSRPTYLQTVWGVGYCLREGK